MVLTQYLKRFLFLPLIVKKYGCASPQVIRLSSDNIRVHVNPRDWRAYKKLVIDLSRGRESTPILFWKDHAGAFPTATMLDIGANYGECFFSTLYQNQHCIAVEANPRLCEYLEMSRDEHPDKDRLQILNVLASDTERADVPFYFDPEWTGTGCGVDSGEASQVVVNVSSGTLDEHLDAAGVDTSRPLVFKMDIEGFEAKAMRGFQSLTSFARRIGIIEFDTLLITRAGDCPESLFNGLMDSHLIYLTHRRSRQLTPVSSWLDLQRHFSRNVHCDLVITSDVEMLAPGWSR